MIEFVQMSDYKTESHLFANLSKDDESQRNVLGNTRNDEQSEEILLRMIRGRDVMTTNNVTTLVDVIGASSSKVNANRTSVGREPKRCVTSVRILQTLRNRGVRTKLILVQMGLRK